MVFDQAKTEFLGDCPQRSYRHFLLPDEYAMRGRQLALIEHITVVKTLLSLGTVVECTPRN